MGNSANDCLFADRQIAKGIDLAVSSGATVINISLGGGSANAAVTLLALNELHGHPLDQVALQELAVGLGSDVPFFLQTALHFGTNSLPKSTTSHKKTRLDFQPRCCFNFP